MNAMKKTMLATAVLMSLGATAAEAAVTNFTYTGSFVMYDGTDPANMAQFDYTGSNNPLTISSGPNPSYNPNYGQYVGPMGSGSFSGGNIMSNGNGAAGDPISGTMSIDMGTGAGTATMTGTPFFGSSWSANNVVFSAGAGAGQEHATMLFNWGAVDTSTACGLANCGIHVAVDFQMYPTANPMQYGFYTIGSYMFDGPFVGAQPTFSGLATVVMPAAVPVPAAAWLLGSGLLGLVGVARRKAA